MVCVCAAEVLVLWVSAFSSNSLIDWCVCVCVYLEVGHLGVALLGASVIRQLNVPEAGQLVHQDRVLLYEGVEDVLRTVDRQQTALTTLTAALLLLCWVLSWTHRNSCFSGWRKPDCVPESEGHRGIKVLKSHIIGLFAGSLATSALILQPVELFTKAGSLCTGRIVRFKIPSRLLVKAQQTHYNYWIYDCK